MKFYKKLPFLLLSLVILSCSESNEDALVKKAGAPLLNGLGNHSHNVSTENAAAQRYFNQGLVLSFAFNHAESLYLRVRKS